MNEINKIRMEKLNTIADARADMLKKQVEAEVAAKNAAVAALNKILSDDLGDLHGLFCAYIKATGKYGPEVKSPKGKKVVWYSGIHGTKAHPHKPGIAYVVETGTSTYYHTLSVDGTYMCQTDYGNYYGCDIGATDAVDFLAGVEAWINRLYALIDEL